MRDDLKSVLQLRLRHGWALMLTVAVLATAVAAACGHLGWLDEAERAAYDRGLTTFTPRSQLSFPPARGLSQHVVVVAIDQQSVIGIRANPSYALNFGSYPWSRNLWARVLEELKLQGARAVVFDAVMDERSSDVSSDLAFAQALRDTGLPFYLGFSTDESAPPLPKAEPLPAPLEPPPPSPPESDTFEDAFVETPEADIYPPTDPREAARALSFSVRTPGHPLPGLEGRHPNPPIGPLLPVMAGFGLVEHEPDADGRMRRTRFAYSDGNNAYATLPIRAAAGLFGAREVLLEPGLLRLGSHSWAIDADGGAGIDFGGTLEERFHLVPLIAVLDSWSLRHQGQPANLAPDTFRDKVVVIGGLAVGLGDVKATPFSPEAPGVTKQAAVLDNLLAGRFITSAPFSVSLLLAFALALLSTLLLMGLRWTPLEIGWPVALLLGTFTLTGLLLAHGRLHLLTALPVLAGVLASLSAVAFNHLFANREAAFVQRAFRQYMDATLVEQMVAERKLPRLDGENREITAFFSDIRGFSGFSEGFRNDPGALVRILNTYLTRVSAALIAEGGCLDKYIGDAVVCLYGAPLKQEDHALRACRGALAVKAEVERLRAEFRAQGLPDVYTRIGLNSGVMFVGNFGSEQLFDYTAIGDDMNLASRLEGANKAYGSLIMMGPHTYALTREHVEVRELDTVRVAGKKKAVTVYELLALKGRLDAEKRETVARYHEALALYREGRFTEAAAVLEARLAEDSEDGPCRAMLERCRHFQAEPPPQPFDGIVDLDK